MSSPAKASVILEWKYSPPDYFEAPISLVRDAYSIAIAHGRVEVRVEASLFDRDPQLQEALHDAVIDWFVGAQLASRRAYELSERRVTRVYFDAIAGRGAESRPEAEPTMADLAETYSTADPLLDSLLRRYDQAVTEPARELAALCAIPEALATIFGGEGAALAALDVGEADWSRLGELAELESRRARSDRESPERASRVSDAERAEARAIALRMILAYLRYTKSAAGAASR